MLFWPCWVAEERDDARLGGGEDEVWEVIHAEEVSSFSFHSLPIMNVLEELSVCLDFLELQMPPCLVIGKYMHSSGRNALSIL